VVCRRPTAPNIGSARRRRGPTSFPTSRVEIREGAIAFEAQVDLFDMFILDE